MPDTRAEVRRLVELVDESGLAEVKTFLQFVLDRADFDTVPLSAEAAAEADRAWTAHRNGAIPSAPLDVVRGRVTSRGRG